MLVDDLGPVGDTLVAKFMAQCVASGAGPDLPKTIDWVRSDMAVDETLREMLVIGATQPALARFIAAHETGVWRERRVNRQLLDWLEVAEGQVDNGQIVPLWRRFVTSDDVSVSLLYPDHEGQIVTVVDALGAGLQWAQDGGRSALAWGLAHPHAAREAFDIPRRLKARIERVSSRVVDFDVEAAHAQEIVAVMRRDGGGVWYSDRRL